MVLKNNNYLINKSVVLASWSVRKGNCKKKQFALVKQLSSVYGCWQYSRSKVADKRRKTNLPHSLQHFPGVCWTLHPCETNVHLDVGFKLNYFMEYQFTSILIKRQYPMYVRSQPYLWANSWTRCWNTFDLVVFFTSAIFTEIVRPRFANLHK